MKADLVAVRPLYNKQNLISQEAAILGLGGQRWCFYLQATSAAIKILALTAVLQKIRFLQYSERGTIKMLQR